MHQPLWVISVRRYKIKRDLGGKSKNMNNMMLYNDDDVNLGHEIEIQYDC